MRRPTGHPPSAGRHAWAPAAVLLVVIVGAGARYPAAWEPVRVRVFDLLQTLHPRPGDAGLHPVMIADIDEESLRRLGQWPWPRDRVADLVERIAAGGPAVIGLDLIFPEPDGRSPEQIAARYPGLPEAAREALAALPANDQRLASSLSRAPVVLGMGPVLTTGGAGKPFRHPPARLSRAELAAALPAYDAVIRSVDPIDAAAAGHACLAVAPERDGVVRRIPAAVRIGEAIVPSLAVEMLRVATGARWFGLDGEGGAVDAVRAGAYRAPTDPHGRLWVPFGSHAGWRFVPAHEVLSGAVAPERFRNRLVLVGTTALGLADVHATPLEERMHGVEIQAQLLEAMLEGSVPRRPAWTRWAEPAAAAIAGLVLIALMARVPARRGMAVFAAAAALLAVACWAAYGVAHLLLDPSLPLSSCAATFAVMVALQWRASERERRAAEAALAAERDRTLRLEGEMEAAREIQMGMLPRSFPAFPNRRDFDVHALILPAKAVGGDLYDFFLLDDRRLFFLVGDVSGKGAPAALFMALTKATCRTAALRRAARDEGAAAPTGGGVAEVLREASQAVGRESGGTMFVTLFAGMLDVATGDLEWASAGHEPPLLAGPSGQPPRRLAADGGPPLGAVEEFPYRSAWGRLEAGTLLLLFTDGVTEAVSPSGERFTADRLVASLEGAGDLSAREASERVYAAVTRFAAGAEQGDDITLLALRRSAGAASAATPRRGLSGS